jgi:hypothetical protein
MPSVRLWFADCCLNSQFLRSAVDILALCEAQTGATARSKFLLANILKEMGTFDEVDELLRGVEADLGQIGREVTANTLTEEFMEQFVLYCHRWRL